VDELQSHAHLHHKSPETSETAFDFKERSHNFILARRLSARHSPTDCERSPRTSTEGPGIDSPLLSAARKALTGPNAPHLPSGLERGHSAPLLQPEERLPSNAKSLYDDKLTVHAGQRGSSVSTTIGLLVHSLADGISLGASAAVSANTKGDSSAVSLDVIVFLAIMVHKAPAAFGLATVLLGDGWPRNRIRVTLTAFAATAPMGAVLTFFLLKLVSHVTGGANETESMKYWTGIALLFSGGTFVRVHSLSSQALNVPVSSSSQRTSCKKPTRR
jgi:zinc transporter ZupT